MRVVGLCVRWRTKLKNKETFDLPIGGDSIRVVHPLFQTEGDGSTPISPLHLEVALCHYSLAEKLCDLWHSRMPYIGCASMCSPCFAASFDNRFYAVAMWSLPIAANRLTDGAQCLELRRMAIADDAPKNTASRMLSIMRKKIKKIRPDIKRLISYQDTEVHTGTIYKASGWTPVHSQSKYVSWENHPRPGMNKQSEAPKVRWEIDV